MPWILQQGAMRVIVPMSGPTRAGYGVNVPAFFRLQNG